MPNSDDEGDSCVLLGTALIDLMPEDAKFSVKAKRQEEQIVTDERGRQRFHGAFTGGFSAGYFNSVGSKEGWAPSTFKSSRSEKNDKKTYQRPEDFMDDDDFGDHGIAPKQLKVKSSYKDEVKSVPLSSKNYLANSFDQLITPTRNTIGVKMARKMGWREGQGVGPRIKRKLRNLKTKIYHEPGRKIYGVTLPTENDLEDDDDIDEDDYLVGQFDLNEFQFVIKEDLFGLGYKRLDVKNLFSHNDSSKSAIDESPAASLLFPMIDKKPKATAGGMRGQAFGGGDFDEDEDEIDVYKQDSMESYNFDLDGKNQKEAKKMLNKSYGFGAFEEDIMILKKFFQSNKRLEPSKVFKGPEVPADFNLKHKLSTNLDASLDHRLKTASERGELLNEPSLKPESIFDLISPEDKNFLNKVKIKHGLIKEDEPKTVPQLDLKRNNEEEKAKRYEFFVQHIKKDFKDPYSFLNSSNLTEWEKEKEKEEFHRTYENHLKQVEQAKKMTSKFVSTKVLTEQNEEIEIAKQPDNEIKNDLKEEIDEKLIDVHKAAREKKYGQMTRTEYEWRPHPTVCKRFNVPNPYPIAAHDQKYGTVGNESNKRTNTIEKFSVFNFITASTRFDKEKSKSLFDELNSDAATANLIGPSHAKIVKLPNDNKTTEKVQIEFDSKNVKPTDSSKKSEFSIINDKTPIITSIPIVKETSESKINNIYLQERPEEIDLFKAIFEDDEDEDDDISKQPEVEPDEIEEPEIKKIEKKDLISSEIISAVPSTIKNININDVKKYIEVNEDYNEDYNEEKNEESMRIIFKKPGDPRTNAEEKLGRSEEKNIIFRKPADKNIKDTTDKSENSSNETTAVRKPTSEVLLFTKLVQGLVKKTESKKSSSSSSSSDSSDSDEIVFEEVSISKKSESEKKHKKKKKKKKHHKKSKKSKSKE